ncbi:MAG: cytochrome c3 family protein, partial [Bacteroidota bacterium]
TKHVECEDCHNPHQTNDVSASAPLASGFIQGVKGVNTDGNEIDLIQNQYELCYRCHSDNAVTGSSSSRLVEQNNVRIEFDPSNLSSHPIENGVRPNNSAAITLISPYDQTSVIYCTDCHSSDGTGAPNGPHGSQYPQILKFNYERLVWDRDYFGYELCFQCHEQAAVTALHVLIRNSHSKKASCNVCHDPHGVTDSPYLLNWNLAEVFPNTNGDLYYVDLGPGHGECYMMCHNHDHDPAVY